MNKKKIRELFEKNPLFFENLFEFFSEIEEKANNRISLISINPQERSSPFTNKYWEEVRNVAKLGKDQCKTIKDPQKFMNFLEKTESILSEVLTGGSNENLLQDLLRDE